MPLTQEIKENALILLMLAVLKINGELKTRGRDHKGFQQLLSGKNERSSPALDFSSFKHARGAITKEDRGIATPAGKKREGEDQMLVRLTGALDSLLVESDPDKWEKCLVKKD